MPEPQTGLMLMKDLESFVNQLTRKLSTLYLVGHQVRKLANELSGALKVFEQVDVYLVSQLVTLILLTVRVSIWICCRRFMNCFFRT